MLVKHLKRVLGSAFVFNVLLLMACSVPDVPNIKRSQALESPFILQEASRDRTQEDFSGAESCKECHLKIFNRWSQTAHNRELTKQDHDAPPHQGSCRRCHHTSAQEAVVSCEACHGPRASHVLQSGKVDTSACAICDIHKMCITCHIRSIDPDFEPAKGWAGVGHGKQQ